MQGPSYCVTATSSFSFHVSLGDEIWKIVNSWHELQSQLMSHFGITDTLTCQFNDKCTAKFPVNGVSLLLHYVIVVCACYMQSRHMPMPLYFIILKHCYHDNIFGRYRSLHGTCRAMSGNGKQMLPCAVAVSGSCLAVIVVEHPKASRKRGVWHLGL